MAKTSIKLIIALLVGFGFTIATGAPVAANDWALCPDSHKWTTSPAPGVIYTHCDPPEKQIQPEPWTPPPLNPDLWETPQPEPVPVPVYVPPVYVPPVVVTPPPVVAPPVVVPKPDPKPPVVVKPAPKPKPKPVPTTAKPLPPTEVVVIIPDADPVPKCPVLPSYEPEVVAAQKVIDDAQKALDDAIAAGTGAEEAKAVTAAEEALEEANDAYNKLIKDGKDAYRDEAKKAKDAAEENGDADLIKEATEAYEKALECAPLADPKFTG